MPWFFCVDGQFINPNNIRIDKWVWFLELSAMHCWWCWLPVTLLWSDGETSKKKKKRSIFSSKIISKNQHCPSDTGVINIHSLNLKSSIFLRHIIILSTLSFEFQFFWAPPYQFCHLHLSKHHQLFFNSWRKVFISIWKK